jgi:hypothetical protein
MQAVQRDQQDEPESAADLRPSFAPFPDVFAAFEEAITVLYDVMGGI